MLQNFSLRYAFLFTKSDKLSTDKKHILKIEVQNMEIFENKIKIFTSAKTKEGIKELKSEIIKLIQ